MENAETILRELEEFERSDSTEIPRGLEEYLQHIAKTGDVVFPWSKAKNVIRKKLENAIAEFHKFCPTEDLQPSPNVEPFNFETQKEKIFEQFDMFSGAPFTIQRLCEILVAPQRHYKRTDKFMRGIEKNLLVVSTVEPGQRKRTDSISSGHTLLNGIPESEDVPIETTPWSAATSYPGHSQAEHKESEAADNISVSDADSGISDTEDEDSSKKEEKKLTEESEEKKETETNEDSKDADENVETKEIAESAEARVGRAEEEEEDVNGSTTTPDETTHGNDNRPSPDESEEMKDVSDSSKVETDTNDQVNSKDNEVDMESLADDETTNQTENASSPADKKRTLDDVEHASEDCHAAKQQKVSVPDGKAPNDAAAAAANTDTLEASDVPEEGASDAKPAETELGI